MLLLLSPAKKLDYDSPVRTELETQPLFVEQAQGLIDILRTQSEQDIAGLMKLSDDLARLNVQRYQEWEPKFDRSNARQAILAFNGDVYEGTFVAGKRQGQGTMRYATGEVAEGNWSDGTLTANPPAPAPDASGSAPSGTAEPATTSGN